MKICRTCGLSRPVGEFWGQPSNKDGKQSECKDCMRLRTAAWYRSNRERRIKDNVASVVRGRIKSPTRAMLKGVRERAKRHGLAFRLTLGDLVIPTVCPVLGIPLKSGFGTGQRGFTDNSPSLDRIDNSIGYLPENIVVVSMRVNRIKSNASIGELRKIADWYERYAARQGEGDWDYSTPEARAKQDTVSAMLSFSS